MVCKLSDGVGVGGAERGQYPPDKMADAAHSNTNSGPLAAMYVCTYPLQQQSYIHLCAQMYNSPRAATPLAASTACTVSYPPPHPSTRPDTELHRYYYLSAVPQQRKRNEFSVDSRYLHPPHSLCLYVDSSSFFFLSPPTFRLFPRSFVPDAPPLR